MLYPSVCGPHRAEMVDAGGASALDDECWCPELHDSIVEAGIERSGVIPATRPGYDPSVVVGIQKSGIIHVDMLRSHGMGTKTEYPDRLDLPTGTIHLDSEHKRGTFVTGWGKLVWESRADGTLRVSCDDNGPVAMLPGRLEDQLASAHQTIYGVPPGLGAF